MKKLTVHPNGRYLMWEDGTPFFYLGDTAWEMFHRLSRTEIEYKWRRACEIRRVFNEPRHGLATSPEF